MTPKASDGLPSPLIFEADTATRRKKGAHKPVFAKVFGEPGTSFEKPSCVHLLVNPYSGKRKGRAVAKEVISRLQEHDIEVNTSYSAYSGHLVTLASALVVKKGDIIAVVGGDGTLSEVITGRMLLKKGTKETFAIVPAGTGNSQAHDLGLSDVDDAVNAILSGHMQALDLAG